MKHDLGALRKYPAQHWMFRLTQKKLFLATWPPEVIQEAAIFVQTPDISMVWLHKNMPQLSYRKIRHLKNTYPELKAEGYENMLTATYSDAVYYMNRRPVGANMPKWAIPFFLDDYKRKSQKEVFAIWGLIQFPHRTIDYGNLRNIDQYK